MKIMQLNIWGGRLTNRVIQLIKDEQPDIVCMQEVYDSDGVEIVAPGRLFDSLGLITEAGEYAHTFFAPHYTVNYGGHEVGYGNAIVSMQPFVSQETVFIKGAYRDNVDPSDTTLHRQNGAYNLQLAQVDIDGTGVTIANHHGYWLPNPQGDQTSADCMQKVADTLRAAEGPLIFTGDLNVEASSPAMRVFDGFLEDLTATHDLPSTLSQLHYVDSVACDHILISPDITVRDFRAVDALASDHQALVLEFDV